MGPGLHTSEVHGQVQSVLVPFRQTVQVDCDHGLHWSIQNLHILAGIFSLDILFSQGKSPLLMRNIQVNFGDILPETSKSNAFWDMGVDSHLKWLLLFSQPYGIDKCPIFQLSQSEALKSVTAFQAFNLEECFVTITNLIRNG